MPPCRFIHNLQCQFDQVISHSHCRHSAARFTRRSWSTRLFIAIGRNASLPSQIAAHRETRAETPTARSGLGPSRRHLLVEIDQLVRPVPCFDPVFMPDTLAGQNLAFAADATPIFILDARRPDHRANTWLAYHLQEKALGKLPTRVAWSIQAPSAAPSAGFSGRPGPELHVA